MPLVSVVFPLPNSPESKTSVGARSFSASFRPQAMVSSAECVKTSSVTLLQLLEQFPASKRDCVGHFAGKNSGGIGLFGEKIGGAAVEINSQRHDSKQIVGAKLSDEAGKQTG